MTTSPLSGRSDIQWQAPDDTSLLFSYSCYALNIDLPREPPGTLLQRRSGVRGFRLEPPSYKFARALDAPGLQAGISAFLAGDDRQAPIVYEVSALAAWWAHVVDGGVGIQASTGSGAPWVSAGGAISQDDQAS
jgi:hypothetical protein